MARIDIIGHVGLEHHLLLAQERPAIRQLGPASKDLVGPLRGRMSCIGGSAAFASRMAQELGVPFNLISSVGASDLEARIALAYLKRLRLSPSCIQRVGCTNVFYSLWLPDCYHRKLYLSIGSEPGREFIEASLARQAQGAVIYDLGNAEILSAIIEHCHGRGRRMALALNQNTVLMRERRQFLTGKIDLVSMSEAELAALCGDESLSQGVQYLLASQGREGTPIFVVTRGPEGILVVNAGSIIELPGQSTIQFPLGGGDMLTLATFVRCLEGVATCAAVVEAMSHTTKLMHKHGQRLPSHGDVLANLSKGGKL